ncbi:hypothetical protein QR680_018457 [Steinernema hermaphroditum]|uniref:BED-type domain-containing protein n=1 Tax=Steinernema hermaphroditum TaxID=289476 RepID=A0AA39LR20_9BILA|nr:hypothetical protein QR680_018457 [Steinernema hermaphroditum]
MKDVYRDYFELDKQAQTATCLACAKTVPMKGGNTSGIRSHLKVHHRDVFDGLVETTPQRPPKRSAEEDPTALLEALGVISSSSSVPRADLDENETLADAILNESRSNESFAPTPQRKMKDVYIQYFKWDDKEAASCRQCGRVVPTKNGNTSGLRSHLKYHHKDDYAELISASTQTKRAKVDDTQESIEALNTPQIPIVRNHAHLESQRNEENGEDVNQDLDNPDISLQDQLILAQIRAHTEQAKLAKQQRKESHLRCQRLKLQIRAMTVKSVNKGAAEVITVSSESDLESDEE